MLRTYIQVASVDSSDVSVGIAVNDVMLATVVVDNSVIYYLVDAPKQKDYHLLSKQVRAIGGNNE